MADPIRTSRRRLIAGGAALAAAGLALAARPRDRSGPVEPYFRDLAAALSKAGIAGPALVIDRARLLANAARVKTDVERGKMALRLVAKSLPSFPLLDLLAQATGSGRMMTFNQPFTSLIAAQRPNSRLLLGKPLTVAAAAAFYRATPRGGFDAARQLEWLIDSPERLAQYADLARGQDLNLQVNLEIDVGLHRGGARDAAGFAQILDGLKAEPRLKLAGLMGYDPHLAKLPDALGLRRRAIAASKAAYDGFLAQTLAALGGTRDGLTLNTAGSPTFRLHDGSGAANEVAVGSALVKPTDFDLPGLADLEPAAFIAAPVLKALDVFQVPMLENLAGLMRAWDPNVAKAFFIHGGHWMARPVSPPGLRESGLYGLSSNQQVMTGAAGLDLKPDDWVFFRPTQSEALFLQFGDLLVVEGGAVTERWPVFPASA